MKRSPFFILSAALVFILASQAAAAPQITSISSTPAFLTQAPGTAQISIRAAIQDPSYVTGSALLQQLQPNGTWKNLAKMKGPATALTAPATVSTAQTTNHTFRVSALFRGVQSRVLSAQLAVPVGELIPPGAPQTTINGPGGTKLIVPPNQSNNTLLAGITVAPPPSTPLPAGGLQLISSFDVIFQRTNQGPATTFELIRDSSPYIWCVPVPINTPGPDGIPGNADDGAPFSPPIDPPPANQSIFIYQEVSADADGTTLTTQKLPVLTATVVTPSPADCTGPTCVCTGATGNQINGTSDILGGPYGNSRTYRIVRDLTAGSGFVMGTVSGARPGVYVKNTDFMFYTDSAGAFKMPNSGSDFTLAAFDWARCAAGAVIGTLPTPEGFSIPLNSDIQSNTINPNWVATRAGIRNSGFELLNEANPALHLTCWKTTGTVNPVQEGALPSDPPSRVYTDLFNLGTTIHAVEGNWMLGIESVNGMIEQQFRRPAGVTMLHFDFNFGCPPGTGASCPGNSPNPAQIQATLSNGTTTRTFTQTFSQFQGQLGWRTGDIDVSGFSAGELLTLRFTASNQGTTQSAVLIDNIRFETVFLDVKLLTGSGTTENDVRTQVRNANEILAQAGYNVRLRNVRPISVLEKDCVGSNDELPSFANLTDTLDAPSRTNEMIQLLCQFRTSSPAAPTDNTDVHVYYIPAFSDPTLHGLAVTSDDYNGVDNTSRGIIIKNITALTDLMRETLAHELGHLLIRGASAGSQEEHMSDVVNIMKATGVSRTCVSTVENPRPCPSRTIIDSVQTLKFAIDVPSTGPSCPVTCPH